MRLPPASFCLYLLAHYVCLIHETCFSYQASIHHIRCIDSSLDDILLKMFHKSIQIAKGTLNNIFTVDCKMKLDT